MTDGRPPPAPPRATLNMLLFVAGWLLIAVSPLVGALPGPGGIFVFAGGLSLVLKTSRRAQRQYVKFKRRWPRWGRWCDWGLRRPSHRRRCAVAAQRAAD